MMAALAIVVWAAVVLALGLSLNALGIGLVTSALLGIVIGTVAYALVVLGLLCLIDSYSQANENEF